MKKRVLSIILALIMTVTMVPAMAFAETAAADPSTVSTAAPEDTESATVSASTSEPEPASAAAPSKSVLSERTYNIAEFETERIRFTSGYIYSDVKSCTVADKSIADVYHSYYGAYVEITGKQRGTTTFSVTLANGSVETYTINITPAPFVITESPYNDEIDRGDYDYIAVTEGFEEYTWTVEDESILKLESYYSLTGYKQKITALNKGETMVSVTNEYGDYAAYIINVVADEFTVEGEINPVIPIEVGDYVSLDIPYDYDWDDCTFSVGNTSVAYAEYEGYNCYAYGVAPGDTVMTVTNQYGETVKCILHVYAELTKLSFTKDEYTVWMGQTLKLPYNIAPLKSNNRITFSVPSWYDDVVSVSEDGVVTPLAVGNAYGIEMTSESYEYDECDIIVKAPYFSKKSYTVYKKKTLQLKLNGGRSDTKWSSSKKSVATVSSSGKVTAKKAGTTTITANSGGYKVKTTIKVSNPKLSKKSASIWAGKTLKLKVTGGTGTVKWSSSNKKVATVNSSGKITAKKAGTATISAKVSGVTLKCKVTVKGPKISKTKKTLIAKQTYKLTVKGATSKIKWSSSNKKVASVSSSGKVTAKKAGTATIKAKVNGKTLKCKVTVKKNQITYRVDTDPNQYYYGEPTVMLKKAYYDGNKLKVDLIVINNRMFKASKFNWIIYKLYDNNGKLIASKKFKNVKLNISPYSSKKITLTFKGSSLKKKNAILNKGVDDYWSYYYTYVY